MPFFPNGRTPHIRLYEESDDARNGNWFRLDDIIGNAFQPGSPIQFPPSGVAPGRFGDANNLVTIDVDYAGRITRIVNVGLQITAGQIAPGTITGGPGGSIANETITGLNVLDGSLTGADIQDGSIHDIDIGDVAWGKITGAPTSFPPSGAAGGDLQGSTYPNPIVKPLAITNAKVNDVAWGKITGAPAFYSSPVTRAQIAPNAPCGGLIVVAVPSGMTISPGTVWATIASLSITTRGGSVFLSAASCLSAVGPAGGANCATRWLRDGATQLVASYHNINVQNYGAVPGLAWIDGAPSAATHTYALQGLTEAGVTMITSNVGGGGICAMEVG